MCTFFLILSTLLEISLFNEHLLTPTSVFTLWSASCALRAAFRVKNVTKQHPEIYRKSTVKQQNKQQTFTNMLRRENIEMEAFFILQSVAISISLINYLIHSTNGKY